MYAYRKCYYNKYTLQYNIYKLYILISWDRDEHVELMGIFFAVFMKLDHLGHRSAQGDNTEMIR